MPIFKIYKSFCDISPLNDWTKANCSSSNLLDLVFDQSKIYNKDRDIFDEKLKSMYKSDYIGTGCFYCKIKWSKFDTLLEDDHSMISIGIGEKKDETNLTEYLSDGIDYFILHCPAADRLIEGNTYQLSPNYAPRGVDEDDKKKNKAKDIFQLYYNALNTIPTSSTNKIAAEATSILEPSLNNKINEDIESGKVFGRMDFHKRVNFHLQEMEKQSLSWNESDNLFLNIINK
ncbi:MAG: hypothetical protein AAF433_19995 [Bacteroidota bacterium]